VPTLIDTWADLEIGTVDVTIGGTNIRLNLSPQSAAGLGQILIREAARVKPPACPDGIREAQDVMAARPAASM
jgi:hypothetical protein